MDGTIDHEQDGNPRKRSNADTIDYPRRRATIAVCCGFLLCRALILLLITYTVRNMQRAQVTLRRGKTALQAVY